MMLLSPYRFSLLVLISSGVALLRYENGSYTDVLIAFDRGIIRDEEQVKNLEKLIKVASRDLYVATGGLAYFKEVRIILAHSPEEFGRDKIAGRISSFAKADIRVGSPNVEYGTRDAFTLQAGECGEEGKFILLSDTFLKDLHSENAIQLAARRLVQEWARYRYGVFDELHTLGEELFAWVGNEIWPVTCVDRIRGWAMTEDHERCVLDSGRVRSNCRFFPDLKNNSDVESSLMSYPHIPSVKHFCNKGNHNTKAPSLQNRMCDSKSIMEVILEHNDFKDERRRPYTTKKVPPEDTHVIRNIDSGITKLEILFVVESSQMMEKVKGTQEVQHFIERFFVHLAPRRTFAGFVKFSDESKTLWKWMQVRFKHLWRKDRILNVSTPVGSPSAIPDVGKALHEAYERYIVSSLWSPTIILISTGNVTVEVKQYNSWERKKMATIHSIAVGRELNWKLDRVSQMTGGDSYSLGDATGRGEPRSFNLDMAFLASMHSTVDEQPVVIRYERFTLSRKQANYSFRVDDGIGKDLVVTVSPNYASDLINPDRNKASEKTHQYRFGSSAKSIFVDDAQPGRWELQLRRQSDEREEHVDIMITAKPRLTNVYGSWIWVRAWITNVTEEEKGLGTKGYHRIYAEVKKGSSPIINATVVATIVLMDRREPIRATLRDNGAGPDVFKEDGIYSSFLPVTKRTAGRPIVIVRVSNDDRKARMKSAGSKKSRATHGMLDDDDRQRVMKKFGASKHRFSPDDDFAKYNTTKPYFEERIETVRICSVQPFTRAMFANSPILFPMSEAEVRRIRPASIRDLKVVKEFIREGGFFAVMQWTTPEHPGDGMKGEAQKLEVNISECMSKYAAAGKILNLFLALIPIDNAGNRGEVSNIAEAFFERPFLEGGKVVVDRGKRETESRSWVPWTVVVVVVVIVAAVVGAVGYLRWKKKKKGECATQPDRPEEQRKECSS